MRKSDVISAILSVQSFTQILRRIFAPDIDVASKLRAKTATNPILNARIPRKWQLSHSLGRLFSDFTHLLRPFFQSVAKNAYIFDVFIFAECHKKTQTSEYQCVFIFAGVAKTKKSINTPLILPHLHNPALCGWLPTRETSHA